MKTQILAFVILVWLMTGCSKEPDLAALSTQPLKVVTFTGGRENQERLISPPSREHELLATWAKQNKEGWSKSYVSYAPGTLVTGTNFSLNIQPSTVILNINGRQYSHPANTSDFVFLTQ